MYPSKPLSAYALLALDWILLKELKCLKCGASWIVKETEWRYPDRHFLLCPDCQTRYWGDGIPEIPLGAESAVAALARSLAVAEGWRVLGFNFFAQGQLEPERDVHRRRFLLLALDAWIKLQLYADSL